jgi:hypothetical protein
MDLASAAETADEYPFAMATDAALAKAEAAAVVPATYDEAQESAKDTYTGCRRGAQDSVNAPPTLRA